MVIFCDIIQQSWITSAGVVDSLFLTDIDDTFPVSVALLEFLFMEKSEKGNIDVNKTENVQSTTARHVF